MRFRRSAALGLAGLVALGALGVTSCGAKSTAADSSLPDDLGDLVDLTGKTEVTINVVDNSYTPRGFKVSPGTKVTFTNNGSAPHNVTADTDGSFDQVALAPGASGVLLAPQKPGTYRFHCSIHGNQQRGAVIVTPPG